MEAQRLLTDCSFRYVAQLWLQFKASERVERSLSGADWRYVVGKTSHVRKDKHTVPLPTQTLALLRELHKHRVVDEQSRGWVFRSPVSAGRAITKTLCSKPYGACGLSVS